MSCTVPFSATAHDSLIAALGSRKQTTGRIALPCKEVRRLPVHIILGRILNLLRNSEPTVPFYTIPSRGFFWFTKLQGLLSAVLAASPTGSKEHIVEDFIADVDISFRLLRLRILPRCQGYRVDVSDCVFLKELTTAPVFERATELLPQKRHRIE